MGGQKKITITDVAKAAGVSNSAVSYALNGKPGVSEETREKVLKVADRMGWKPNGAAQALARSAARRIGLILDYDPKLFGVESYMMELIAGLGSELEPHNYALLIRLANSRDAQLAIIRDWIATGSADAMLALNLELGDPRIGLLKEHPEMPALIMGSPTVADGLPALWSDDAGAANKVMEYLHGLGHRHIARVAGPETLGHTFIRDHAFSAAATRLGIQYRCLHADYTPASGAEATRRLLGFGYIPTAIVYDNDVMAVAGLDVATGAGISVPSDLSIISWDDSYVCTAVYPNLTSMSRDVVAAGRQAARMLLSLISGESVPDEQESPYTLVERDTTGRAPMDY